MLTGIRAEKGWWTCEEDLWVSNVDLSRSEFEDWRSIPLEAFEDAKRKRIRKNKALFNSRASMIINLGRQRYRLIANAEKQLFEKDKQIDILLVKDSDFDTVAWAQVRAYVDHGKVVLEDLFVKPEVRRMGIGSELLRQIEYLTCFDRVFREVSEEITVPIPTVDIWLPMRHQTVKAFYARNGYKWNDTKIVPGREYSIFTASKKLACAQIPKESNSITTVVRAWLIRHLRLLRHREPNEGPCAVQIRVLNSDFIDAWVSVNRP
jgi:GNAT superfamily N-acetyltransferase